MVPHTSPLPACWTPSLARMPVAAVQVAHVHRPSPAPAATYDELDGGAAAKQLGFPALRQSLLARARGDVLETAVGTGLNLPYYQPAALTSLTGIDLSGGMLAQAAARAQRLGLPDSAGLRLVQADVERLQEALGGQTYDTGALQCDLLPWLLLYFCSCAGHEVGNAEAGQQAWHTPAYQAANHNHRPTAWPALQWWTPSACVCSPTRRRRCAAWPPACAPGASCCCWSTAAAPLVPWAGTRWVGGWGLHGQSTEGPPCMRAHRSAALAAPSGRHTCLQHVTQPNNQEGLLLLLLSCVQDVTAPAVAATGKGCRWNDDVPALVRAAGLQIQQAEPHVGGLIVSLVAIKPS